MAGKPGGRIFFGSLLILSLGLILWTITPGERRKVNLVLPPVSFNSFTAASRDIIIEYPKSMAGGRKEIIRLTLGAQTETFPQPVLVQASLELPGAVISPGAVIETVMATANPLTFTWQVRPAGRSAWHGTLWLHFVSGDERLAVMAYPLEIGERRLAGLGMTTLRIAGGVGVFLGLLGFIFLQARKM